MLAAVLDWAYGPLDHIPQLWDMNLLNLLSPIPHWNMLQ